MIVLRPRQKELMKKIRETVKLAVDSNSEKPPRIVVQAPCGFGKTPLMVTMINGAVEKEKKILNL